jgi:hypothetical protein
VNICECGCGQQCKKRFVRGHQLRKPATWPAIQAAATSPAIPSQTMQEIIANGPPPHPLPFDHRLFRLAVERPGTLVTNPWRDFPCSECKLQTWTREEKAEYGTVICEDCLWRLSENQGEKQVQQNRARQPYDPFQ